MPRIKYVEKSFRASTLNLITTADRIVTDYARQGFQLTLRQLSEASSRWSEIANFLDTTQGETS